MNAITTNCPRCGAETQLHLPEDIGPADAQRLSRLALCERCFPDPGPTWELTTSLPEPEVAP